MRSNSRKVLKWTVGIVFGYFALWLLWPIITYRDPRLPVTSSLSNVKQVANATSFYSTDFDDTFPPDMSSVSSCQEFIASYTNEKQSIFKSNNPTNHEFLGNGELSSLKATKVEHPARALMFFEAAPWQDGTRSVAFVDTHASTRKEPAFQEAIAHHLMEKE